MARASTHSRHLHRIEQAVSLLLDSPSAAHSVRSLATAAHLSPFHFHRVFHEVMGETVGATRQRVRLRDAAEQLLSSDAPVARIAESAGYESRQAFTRAFRSYSQVGPAEFRRHYASHRTAAADRSVPPCAPVGNELAALIDIVCEPPYRVLALRHDGAAVAIPLNARRFWRWQLRHALLPRVQQSFGVIYLDEADDKGFRYYSAVAVDAGARVFDDVAVLSLPGGCYARFMLHGWSNAMIAPTVAAMRRDWLPRSGFELDDRPLLERYLLHAWPRDAFQNAVTELLLPVRPRTHD